MLTKESLLASFNAEPNTTFDVPFEALSDAGIDWVELSELAKRNAYIHKKLVTSPENNMAFCDDRVIYLRRKGEA